MTDEALTGFVGGLAPRLEAGEMFGFAAYFFT